MGTSPLRSVLAGVGTCLLVTQLCDTQPHSNASVDEFRVEPARDAQPRWAITYGAEFWRRRDGAPLSGPGRKAALPENADLGDVIARVSHAWRSRPAASVHAEDPAYIATIGRDG